MRIVEAVLRNQSTVLSISSLIQGYQDIHDVCLSLPVVINRSGVERYLRLDLSANEIAGLRRSADLLKGIIAQIALETTD
jgi:L-lactate dehydrogenase